MQTLSQFMQSPKKSHMEAATRVIRYLKGSVGQGVWLHSELTNIITCRCDSDWQPVLTQEDLSQDMSLSLESP